MEVDADAVEAQVASLREEGVTHFICSSFDIIACSCACTHQRSSVHVESTRRASVSLDGKLRIYFGKNANPTVFHFVWEVCESPRHARLQRERDIIATAAPHPSHCRSDCEDGFTKSMCCSFGSQHSGTCTRQHSCVLVLSGWIPKHVREHAMAVHAGWKMLQDTTTPHLFRKDVHLQFQCFGKLFGGRSTTGTDVAELSGRQVLTSVLRLHG